uniref:VP6 n=1 Tax=Middle Point orbivirus TaxID=464979 RepID=A0A8K1I353_9REOV|nr:VP6 [Middle Point orbivirus]
MSRIVLLTPGDVILQCQELLKTRGIRTKLREWEGMSKDKKSGQGEDKGESTLDGKNDTTLLEQRKDGGTSTSDQERNSKQKTDRFGTGKDGSDERISSTGGSTIPIQPVESVPHTRDNASHGKNTTTSMSALLGESKTEAQIREKMEGKRENTGKSGVSQETVKFMKGTYYVLTQDIHDKLLENYNLTVEVTAGKNTIPQDSIVIELGAALMKKLGLQNDARDEQSDEAKRLKRLLTGPKRNKPNVRVDSEKGLMDLTSATRKEKGHVTSTQSRVHLVTNDPTFIDRAHAIFTAPTGDPGWKDLAREATKRANIRAYVYKPGGDVSLQEALATLLDVV